MTQETRVYELDAAAAAGLEQRLRTELPIDAEWRQVPHASFSVKALGTVTTCYRSGKLVVQGRALDAFESRFLGAAQATQKPAPMPFDEVTVASDEAGKGDYFGPLVVAALYARPDDHDRLRALGVTDSKALADRRAITLAGVLEREFDVAIEVLPPPEYNAAYEETRNLNDLLASRHARALSTLLARHADTELVLVDKFASERLVANALARRGTAPPKLVQVPRAEAHPAVAAASIVARAAFLDGLAESSRVCATELPKGAGPLVDDVARELLATGGRDLLAKVAKMHFKTTEKIARGPR